MNQLDIKVAQPEDITQIISFAYQTYRELDDPTMPEPDMGEIAEFVTDAVVNHVVLVARNEENPAILDGCLIMRIQKIWWAKESMVNAALFFVKPDKRSKRLAFHLLNAAKEYAIMVNIPLSVGIISQGENLMRKEKLLQFLGLKKYQTVFLFKG